MMKQVHELIATSWLSFEPKAAKQWFRDIYEASANAEDTIKPLVQKVKDLRATLKDGEEKTEEIKAAEEELEKIASRETVINIIPLPITAKGKDISISTYIILESLHQSNIIKCDLFSKMK